MSYYIAIEALVASVLLLLLLDLPIVHSDDTLPIPADKSQINAWFESQVTNGFTAKQVDLGPEKVKKIKVAANGGGDFKTITDAIKSIPEGNKERVVVSIGPGNYTEKILIDRSKPFITLYGDPNDMPVLVFNGDAAKYGTVYSATLAAEADHFTAVNLKIVNSSPRPDGKRVGAQAVALKAAGEFQAFYNCKLYGYQDTLCDFRGKHFYKDCYIEGTVDFIFGRGTSLYLNSEIHVIPGDGMAIITAQARAKGNEPTGFTFVHCSVTGTGGTAFLGRSWFPAPRVVFAYTDLSDAVNPQGWSNNFNPQTNSTVYFGEYNNKGPGAAVDKRVGFMKKLNDEDAKSFITLGFIEASKWLLPPPKI